MRQWLERRSRTAGCLVLLAVTLGFLLWPVPFARFTHADQATTFDMHEIPREISAPVTAAQLSRAEIAPLLDALDSARVSFRGFERAVPQEEGQRLFSLSFFREAEQGQEVQTADFFLSSDGALYGSSRLWGYARYQLTGFDWDAFAAAWDRLPGMAGE